MRCARSAVVLAVMLVGACKSEAPTRSAAPAPSMVQDAAPADAAKGVASRFEIDAQQRTSAYLAVVRDLYAGKASGDALKEYFPSGEGGEARAGALAKSIADASSKGDRVERYVIRGVKVDAQALRATADVLEWIKNGGDNRCRTFGVVWRSIDGALVQEGDPVDVHDATCPKA